MEVSQIASLATRVDSQELSRRVSTTLLKKTSDNQESTAANLLESIPSCRLIRRWGEISTPLPKSRCERLRSINAGALPINR
ncbi:YjfB family protein [Lonsdalea quercina]|uniref:YjfB family protein n=1 Tax=Lonsdalea quercina TaxID=71657 RepID=UPI003975BB79